MDNSITTPVAVAAATSAVWLPWLQGFSDIAAALLPILGVLWLAVQIATKVIETKRVKTKRDR